MIQLHQELFYDRLILSANKFELLSKKSWRNFQQ
jgi:hypothetical protein